MVYDVAFTAEGERMLTASGGGELGGGSQDTSVRMWDLKSGRQLQKMDIPLPVLMQVAANPQGKDILFTGIGPVVFRFELDNWEQVDELVGHQGFYTPCIEFLPEGSKALSCSADGTLILWNLQNNQPIFQLDGRDQGNGLWAVAISPDGLTALSDSGECSMILWDLETGKELRCFLRDDYSTRRGSSGIAFLPDGKTVISAESDNQLIEWDLETGEEIRRLGEHPSLRTRVVISPDGRFAVTSGMDGRLMVWDLARGTLVRQSDQHGVIFDLTMSPEGESVYFGSSNTTITEWGISNPSIDELKGWIEQNRYLRELTCAEREFYQVEPLCETKRVD
jgi:WD40 repeat protein